MLRCPKCGTDNMLTAIFCRGCGERLNLDEIRPDDFANIGPKKQDTTMQNIIGGAIIGAAALIFLIGWMFPAGGMIKTTEAEQADWKEKAAKIEKGASLEMDDKAATAFLNAYLDDDCTVHFLGDGKAKVVIPTKLWVDCKELYKECLFLTCLFVVTCEAVPPPVITLAGQGTL